MKIVIRTSDNIKVEVEGDALAIPRVDDSITFRFEGVAFIRRVKMINFRYLEEAFDINIDTN